METIDRLEQAQINSLLRNEQEMMDAIRWATEILQCPTANPDDPQSWTATYEDKLIAYQLLHDVEDDAIRLPGVERVLRKVALTLRNIPPPEGHFIPLNRDHVLEWLRENGRVPSSTSSNIMERRCNCILYHHFAGKNRPQDAVLWQTIAELALADLTQGVPYVE